MAIAPSRPTAPPAVRAGVSDRVRTLTLSLPAAGLEATVAPAAGMVVCSLRHAGEELLTQNAGLRAYAETGATMGIPLLHPWANRLGDWEYEALGRHVDLRPLRGALPEDEHGLPIHGIRPRPWRVLGAGARGEAARVSAVLEAGASPAFPFPHRVRMEVELRPGRLRIRTALAPGGPEPVPVCFGFHPYLTLPGAPRPAWRVELPVRRRLVLDEVQIPTGETEPVAPVAGPLGERAYDDGFDVLADPPVFAVEAAGRRAEVAFERGFPVAQVFAPPAKDLVCFEPLTAWANALRAGGFPLAERPRAYGAAFSVAIAHY